MIPVSQFFSSSQQPVNVHLASPKESCPEVMTHVTDGKKRKLQLSWIAPEEGCVMFSAGIVQRGNYSFDGIRLIDNFPTTSACFFVLSIRYI